MNERSVTHATFTLERVYPAPPERVFHAFADPEAKRRWFVGPPEWEQLETTMDFRVGGRETNAGGPKGEWTSRFDSLYWDIVPDQRIVYSYDMHIDDQHISVSLATIELRPEGSGTRLTLTEQGAYLDGYDDAGRREDGTRQLLDQLGVALESEVAAVA